MLVDRRSPSLAVRRIVSAMDCTCAELTGSGSDATAASRAFFMMPMVSGGKDAFEKSFIAFRQSPCRFKLDHQTKSRARKWFNQEPFLTHPRSDAAGC